MQPALAPAVPADNDIVDLLRGGAAEPAFALLLQRYESKVYRLCCALLRDRANAQDVAQESWVRVWKALPRYDGRASFSTWIYTITRNRCFTAMQRQQRLMLHCAEDLDSEVQDLALEPADPQDRSALLSELVELLPERYRRTLVLFYYEERSVGEVADMLGMPEGTVKTYLHRARAALAEQLRRRGLGEASDWLEVRS
jgi:RNA polymerase sigma-70 factor (ECF subfamily)